MTVDADADNWALDLIRLFAAALRDLNNGKPIAKRWRAEIERALGNRHRGAPKRRNVGERQKQVAMRWLQARLSCETGPVASVISAIADERGVEERAVYRDIKAGKVAAYSAELEQRLARRDAERLQHRKDGAAAIRRRIDAGESFDDILRNADFGTHKAIREHQTQGLPLEGKPPEPPLDDYATRHETIKAWVLDGRNRVIDAPSVEAEKRYRLVREVGPIVMPRRAARVPKRRHPQG